MSFLTALLFASLSLTAMPRGGGEFGPSVWENRVERNASRPFVIGDLVVVGCSNRSLDIVGDNFDSVRFYDLATGKLVHRVVHSVPKGIAAGQPIMFSFASNGSVVYYVNSALEVCAVETKGRAFTKRVLIDMPKEFRTVQQKQSDYLRFTGGITVYKNLLLINTRQVSTGEAEEASPSVIAYDLNSDSVAWGFATGARLGTTCSPARPVVMTIRDTEYVLSPVGGTKFCCLEIKGGKLVGLVDVKDLLQSDSRTDSLLFYIPPVLFGGRIYFIPSPDFDIVGATFLIVSIPQIDTVGNLKKINVQRSSKQFSAGMGDVHIRDDKLYLLAKGSKLHVIDLATLESENIQIGMENNQFGSPCWCGNRILVPGDEDIYIISNVNNTKKRFIDRFETMTSLRTTIECVGGKVIYLTDKNIYCRQIATAK